MTTQRTFMHFQRLFCLSALLLLARFGNAQENFILNPSVEVSSEIPSNTAGYVYCENWWNHYIFTTDYFTNLTNYGNLNYIPTNFNWSTRK
jgi:hypothetical protein